MYKFIIMNLLFKKCNILPVHAMKAHRGSRGTAPFILNLEAAWSKVAKFVLLSLKNLISINLLAPELFF